MAKLAKPSDQAEVVKKVSNLTKTDNSEGKKKPLQFIVSEDFHKEFKMYAAEQDMKMNELFDAMYKLYRVNH